MTHESIGKKKAICRAQQLYGRICGYDAKLSICEEAADLGGDAGREKKRVQLTRREMNDVLPFRIHDTIN